MTQPELKRFIVACVRASDEKPAALELAREGLRRFRQRH